MATLTIVTANLNHGRFLAEAIRSVAAQPGVSADHIVVDGGSVDQSHAVLKEFPTLRMEVRPEFDSHMALNHGLALARSELIGFLNADDRYEPGSLHRVIAAFDEDPELEAVCGGVRFFRTDNERETEIRRYTHLEGPAMRFEATFGAPGFNSWFFRTASLRSIGGLRSEWHFAADRDLLMRLLVRTRPKILPGIIYHYRIHEGSRTLAPGKPNRSACAREHIRLARLHAVGDWADIPDGKALLDDWRALEGLKLLAGLHRTTNWRSDIVDLVTTPWWRLPAALWRRRQWLEIVSK